MTPPIFISLSSQFCGLRWWLIGTLSPSNHRSLSFADLLTQGPWGTVLLFLWSPCFRERDPEFVEKSLEIVSVDSKWPSSKQLISPPRRRFLFLSGNDLKWLIISACSTPLPLCVSLQLVVFVFIFRISKHLYIYIPFCDVFPATLIYDLLPVLL